MILLEKTTASSGAAFGGWTDRQLRNKLNSRDNKGNAVFYLWALCSFQSTFPHTLSPRSSHQPLKIKLSSPDVAQVDRKDDRFPKLHNQTYSYTWCYFFMGYGQLYFRVFSIFDHFSNRVNVRWEMTVGRNLWTMA
jgi:hypothetical protein